MSERDQGTEKPTPFRLQQLRKQGDVPMSREVATAAAIALLATFFTSGAPRVGKEIADGLRQQIEHLDDGARSSLAAEGGQVLYAMGHAAFVWMALGALLLGGLAFVGASACFSWERIEMKAERLDPVAGLGRLVSWESVVNIVRSSLVAGVIIGTALWVLRGRLGEVMGLADLTSGAIALHAGRLLFLCTLAAAIAMAAVAVVDVLWARYQHERRHMMSREELRQEMKEQEGDPMLRGRRRRRHRELLKQAVAQLVPKAHVVVANPTHVAVALRYTQGQDRAPVVVAKGVDAMATRIRLIATRSGVPVVENRPLARALLKRVKVGGAIPSDLFRAVAEVLAYVHRQAMRRRQAQRRPQRPVSTAARGMSPRRAALQLGHAGQAPRLGARGGGAKC